jgi:hypothetical protein
MYDMSRFITVPSAGIMNITIKHSSVMYIIYKFREISLFSLYKANVKLSYYRPAQGLRVPGG